MYKEFFLDDPVWFIDFHNPWGGKSMSIGIRKGYIRRLYMLDGVAKMITMDDYARDLSDCFHTKEEAFQRGLKLMTGDMNVQ
jgi:hypothetical protein